MMLCFLPSDWYEPFVSLFKCGSTLSRAGKIKTSPFVNVLHLVLYLTVKKKTKVVRLTRSDAYFWRHQLWSPSPFFFVLKPGNLACISLILLH